MTWLMSALRSLNRSRTRSCLLIFTVTITIASYYGTTSFIHQVTSAIQASSQNKLGGDLLVQSYLEPKAVSSIIPVEAEQNQALSYVIQTQISTGRKASNIILKGIEAEYPFYNHESIQPDGLLNKHTAYLTQTAADRLQIHMGDEVGIPDRNGVIRPFTVAGIIGDTTEAFGDAAIFGCMYIRFDEMNQDILQAEVPLYNERLIKLHPGTSIDIVQKHILNYSPHVSFVTPESLQETTFSEKKSIFFYLQFVSLISLFIAATSIYNSMKMVWLSRVQEIAILKTVGMKSRAISMFLMSESIIIGIIGSVTGLLLGILMSYPFSKVLGNLMNISMGWEIEWNVLFTSLVIGNLVAIVSAFIPSRSLLKTSPLGLLNGDLKQHRLRKSGIGQKMVIFFLLNSVCAFYIRDVLAPGVHSFNSYVTCFIISVAVLLGAMLIMLLGSLSFRFIFYILGKINIVRSQTIYLGLHRVRVNGKRNGLITFVLSVSICSVIASLIFGSAIIASVEEQMKEQIEGNVIVTSPMQEVSSTERALKHSLQISDVKRHLQAQAEIVSLQDISFEQKVSQLQQTNKRVAAMFQNPVVTVESVDTDSSRNYYHIVSGSDLNGTAGEAILLEEFHTDFGLNSGDSIVLRMNGQNLPVTISGFYASGTVKTAFIRISEQDFQPFNQSSRTAFYVDADPATLKQLYAELPPSAMAYSLNQAVIDGLQNLLNTQKTIFTLIGLFTLLMAVLMISNQFINTMIQSKFDFAVLKACGVKNMKIKNAFLLEAGIISLTAGLAGTFISFFVAAIGELLVSGYADVPVRFGWFALGCGIALVVACLVTITVSGRLTKVRPAQLLRQG